MAAGPPWWLMRPLLAPRKQKPIVPAGENLWNDEVYGYDGNDTIFVTSGNTWIQAGDGDDTVFGGADEDRISGGDGDDNLLGNAGNDVLRSGAGHDDLQGGDDDDLYIIDGIGHKTILDTSGADELQLRRTWWRRLLVGRSIWKH